MKCWPGIILLLLFISSCSSLKKNYLSKASRGEINIKPDSIQLNKLDSIRETVDRQSDSLITALIADNPRKRLSSKNLNLLYVDFSKQLQYDRIYNSILQNNLSLTRKKDSLQFYVAAARLLKSADFYNKHYQKYGRIYQNATNT